MSLDFGCQLSPTNTLKKVTCVTERDLGSSDTSLERKETMTLQPALN
jgi:hypothetical protein